MTSWWLGSLSAQVSRAPWKQPAMMVVVPYAEVCPGVVYSSRNYIIPNIPSLLTPTYLYSSILFITHAVLQYCLTFTHFCLRPYTKVQQASTLVAHETKHITGALHSVPVSGPRPLFSCCSRRDPCISTSPSFS